MTEERKTGREAQMSNIRAAVQVAETVRSTLGPAGMDKMLVDERGESIVTNDGITILRELDTAHPGAQMMVQASQTQEEVCKDGTTSVVVLAGQMLALSEGLLMRGIPPTRGATSTLARHDQDSSPWATIFRSTTSSSIPVQTS